MHYLNSSPIKLVSTKNPKLDFSHKTNKQTKKKKKLFQIISSLYGGVTLSKKLEKCHASTPLKTFFGGVFLPQNSTKQQFCHNMFYLILILYAAVTSYKK